MFCMKFFPLGSVGLEFLFLNTKSKLTEKRNKANKLQRPFPMAQRDWRNPGTEGGCGRSQTGCQGKGWGKLIPLQPLPGTVAVAASPRHAMPDEEL